MICLFATLLEMTSVSPSSGLKACFSLRCSGTEHPQCAQKSWIFMLAHTPSILLSERRVNLRVVKLCCCYCSLNAMSASLGYFCGAIKAATPGCSVNSYSITRKSYNFSSVINSYIKSFTVIFNKNSRIFPGKAFGKTTKYVLSVLKLCLEL